MDQQPQLRPKGNFDARPERRINRRAATRPSIALAVALVAAIVLPVAVATTIVRAGTPDEKATPATAPATAPAAWNPAVADLRMKVSFDHDFYLPTESIRAIVTFSTDSPTPIVVDDVGPESSGRLSFEVKDHSGNVLDYVGPTGGNAGHQSRISTGHPADSSHLIRGGFHPGLFRLDQPGDYELLAAYRAADGTVRSEPAKLRLVEPNSETVIDTKIDKDVWKTRYELVRFQVNAQTLYVARQYYGARGVPNAFVSHCERIEAPGLEKARIADAVWEGGTRSCWLIAMPNDTALAVTLGIDRQDQPKVISCRTIPRKASDLKIKREPGGPWQPLFIEDKDGKRIDFEARLAWRDERSQALVGLSGRQLTERFGRHLTQNAEPIAKFSDKGRLPRIMPPGLPGREVWGLTFENVELGASLVIRMWAGRDSAFDAYWCQSGMEPQAFFNPPVPVDAATAPASAPAPAALPASASAPSSSPAAAPQADAGPSTLPAGKPTELDVRRRLPSGVRIAMAGDSNAREQFLLIERFARMGPSEQAKELPRLYRDLAPRYMSPGIEMILSVAPANILDQRSPNALPGNTAVWAHQLADAASELTPEQAADKLACGLWLTVAARARAIQVLRAHTRAVAALIAEDLKSGQQAAAQRAANTVDTLGWRDSHRAGVPYSVELGLGNPPATGPAPSVPSAGSPQAGSAPSTRPAADAAQIERLIRQLGGESFKQREAAQKALVKIGQPAMGALGAACGDADVERANRAQAAKAAIVQDIQAVALRKNGRVCLYLVVEPADTREAVRMKIEDLKLQDKPLLTDSDFTGYDSNTRRLAMSEAAMGKLPNHVDVWGVPFVMVLDGKRWYLGSFFKPASHYMPRVPVTTHGFANLDDHGIATPANVDDEMAQVLRSVFAPAQPATAPASAQRISALISRLGSEKFAERDAAQKGLVAIGVPAVEALLAARSDNDAERSERAKAALADIHAAVRRGSRLAMYLVTDPPHTPDAEKVALEDLKLASDPFLCDEDITDYDWKQHVIRLAPEAQRCLPDVTHGSRPFVVVADGQRCYLGDLYSPISSYIGYSPTIFVDLRALAGKAQESIRIGLPMPKGKDPRGDGRIRKVLAELGKLKAAATAPATH